MTMNKTDNLTLTAALLVKPCIECKGTGVHRKRRPNNDTRTCEDCSGTGEMPLFPRLRVEKVSAPIAGPGLVTQTVSFRCLKWNSTSDLTFSDGGAVSGAPEANSEMWIETDDQRTATMTS